MLRFKKEKPTQTISVETNNPPNSEVVSVNETNACQHMKKKKIKIGFGHKKIQRTKEKQPDINRAKHQDEPQPIPLETQHHYKQSNEKQQDIEDPEFFLQESTMPSDKTSSENKKTEFSSGKKKSSMQKNMQGKPVYLENTGEKLGSVFGMIYDSEKNFVGYKIKDIKSDVVLSFPFEQFEEDKDGLIFVPSWYTRSVKTIEKFEFKDRISPEITTLLVDETISNEELFDIFLKHDHEMAEYMKDAAALKELLLQRLKVLEKQRLALKDNLMDLTEKRLIKDIDRRQFSEDVMEHRRRVNVLDVNITKCKELLKRLEQTSFGMIQKHSVGKTDLQTDRYYRSTYEKIHEQQKPVYPSDMELPYKQKYYELKERFGQLEDSYNELKTAVEKLLMKNEQ